MKLLFVFSLILSGARTLTAQTDTMNYPEGGLLYITDSTKTFCRIDYVLGCGTILGNPEMMRDRWLIDSNDNLVSRMINNPVGYTYYDWNADQTKTHAEFRVYDASFFVSNYYDSGRLVQQKTESLQPYFYNL